ncbi:hypothetical protein SAMN04515656_10587 [Eubacterium aggregans]|jgi:hypothetical protein|uniref:Uncharacterized protein n=1 Tax=Eubacterium aggregans TaxID=81409 RepID=A0A1H3ZAV9_9FIRM|nr:hypothetical protein SAMN04515656_10587 [Eubacterium aggregans]
MTIVIPIIGAVALGLLVYYCVILIRGDKR